MIQLILSLVLLIAPPAGFHSKVRATWYGSNNKHGQKYCFENWRNTCTPYSSGEKVMYAAVPGFRNSKSKPYDARVCYKKRCVVVVVRDCLCSRKGEYIDLSPAAFIALGQHLSRGVLWVSVDYDYGDGR